MYCAKCGAEINDEAVICPKCGCQTQNQLKEKGKEIDDNISAGLVTLSILLPIVGVILGIINLCKMKYKSGAVYLIFGIVTWIVAAIIFSLV